MRFSRDRCRAGGRAGVNELDPADLTQAIQPYLGHWGPAWTRAYVRDSAASVLAIIVNAPRQGDRIFALEKELTVTGRTYLAGTIFVRHHGQTIQADPGDIRALEERLLAPRRDAGERQFLLEIYRLVTDVRLKAEPHASSPAQLDLPEQHLLEHMIGGHERDNPDIYQAVLRLAYSGKGSDLFAAAVIATIEIEARLHELSYDTLPL